MRVVTLVESGSRAVIGAQAGPCGGKGGGERSAARRLYHVLDQEMLLSADRDFYSLTDWCQASDTAAELPWRVGDTVKLPLVEKSGDGSYVSVVFAARTTARARETVMAAARAGEDLEEFEDKARLVRVVEYEVPDRGTDGERELFCLLTTLLDARRAPAARYGSCAAGSIIRRPFPPEGLDTLLARFAAEVTNKRRLHRTRRHRSYPRVVKCARHNQYAVKKATDVGVRHLGPPPTHRQPRTRPASPASRSDRHG